jgi:septum formation protein
MSENGLILASASPRRRELLARICPRFSVQPCPHPEPGQPSGKVLPAQWAQAMAYFKARRVADQNPGRWVLGADTIVACDGELLGKPRDREDARRMLELQARHVSDVITGVCLLRHDVGLCRHQCADLTRVWMRDDPQQREAYLESGDWEGKAGAYGIQTVGDKLVERIEGSFSNVVGLPLELLSRLLTIARVPVAEVR